MVIIYQLFVLVQKQYCSMIFTHMMSYNPSLAYLPSMQLYDYCISQQWAFSEYTELYVTLRGYPITLHQSLTPLSQRMLWIKQLHNLIRWKICSSTSVLNPGKKILRIYIWTPLIIEAGHTMTGSQKVRNRALEVLHKQITVLIIKDQQCNIFNSLKSDDYCQSIITYLFHTTLI